MKSASSDRITSALSTAYCGAAYSLNARRLPSRALWPKYGSHCTHLAAGRRCRISSICAAMRRRRHRLGEDAEARALLRLLRAQHAAHGDDEGAERLNLAEVGNGGGAVGIVEAENRRLREDVGGALARRVIGVALDLGGPAFVALDQQAHARAGKRHRGGVEERLTGDELLGLPARTARALRSAGACRHSRRRGPATPTSASGSRGGRRDRATPRRSAGTRGGGIP